jgi:hypothetical protein
MRQTLFWKGDDRRGLTGRQTGGVIEKLDPRAIGEGDRLQVLKGSIAVQKERPRQDASDRPWSPRVNSQRNTNLQLQLLRRSGDGRASDVLLATDRKIVSCQT